MSNFKREKTKKLNSACYLCKPHKRQGNKKQETELLPVELDTQILNIDHVYISTGFDISGKYTVDGTDYVAPKIHACLSSGIHCEEQLNEQYLLNYYISNDQIDLKEGECNE